MWSFVTRISAEQRQANLALEAAHADKRAADHQRAQELARMQKRGAGRPRKAREVVSSDVTAAESAAASAAAADPSEEDDGDERSKQCICCWFRIICA